MKVRQLFFDLDRTLWDFETNSRFALQYLYDDLKLGETIEHFMHFHHTYIRINADLWNQYGNGKLTKEELRDNRFKKALAHHGIHNNELAQQMSDGYIALSPQQTALFPGAVEMLESLRSQIIPCISLRMVSRKSSTSNWRKAASANFLIPYYVRKKSA